MHTLEYASKRITSLLKASPFLEKPATVATIALIAAAGAASVDKAVGDRIKKWEIAGYPIPARVKEKSLQPLIASWRDFFNSRNVITESPHIVRELQHEIKALRAEMRKRFESEYAGKKNLLEKLKEAFFAVPERMKLRS